MLKSMLVCIGFAVCFASNAQQVLNVTHIPLIMNSSVPGSRWDSNGGVSAFNKVSMRRSFARDTAYEIVAFAPQITYKEIFSLPGIRNIQLIDARFDQRKIGFLPCEKILQQKRIHTIGLQLAGNVTGWLADNFIDKKIITNNNSNRQLVIVVKKFWFSHSAHSSFVSSDPPLMTSLYYRFDIFSLLDNTYYPQKKLEGILSARYNKSKSYDILCDSVLAVLKHDISVLSFTGMETANNRVTEEVFQKYTTHHLNKIVTADKKPGVYASYEDFLANKSIADSVDLILKYNSYDLAPVYACQLVGFNKGEAVSCAKTWGYFDGESIFVNTGNGFYIRLMRKDNDYLFFFLKNISEDKVRSYTINQININNSPYHFLKDYTSHFSLTYQLDYDTGIIY